MKPQIRGQCLQIGDKIVDLGSPIKKVLRAGDRYLALLDPSADNDRNVYCLDNQGNQIWQIEAAPNVDGLARDAWSQMFPIDNERMLGRTFPGFEIEIDLRNGKMIRGTGRDTK